MTDDEVGRYWDQNADAWTVLSRAGYDLYRDLFNTPAFMEMLPDVRGRRGLDIGCGEGWPPEITGEATGSTANTFSFGQAALSTFAQPVRWPPVPTPVMRKSRPSGKSARISCAVVRAWTSTLAGLSNC